MLRRDEHQFLMVLDLELKYPRNTQGGETRSTKVGAEYYATQKSDGQNESAATQQKACGSNR